MTGTCLHCKGDCRLTDGAEVYPHRDDLAERKIWKCDQCDATVGCHPKTTRPLGHAADKATRRARMLLHEQMLDLLWLEDVDRKEARKCVYSFLARALSINARECHTGHFDLDRCRDAWCALAGQTPESIRAWNDQRRDVAQEIKTDRKNKKPGRRRRRASRDDVAPITGSQFCLKQAALNEVPW